MVAIKPHPERVQSRTPPARSQEPTWWGFSADELHDRAWNDHGIAVVRCGGGRVEPKGPSHYLLIEPGARVLFDPAQLRSATAWLHPRVVRLRVVDADQAGYREHVDTDADGVFQGLHRDYSTRGRSTLRAYVTSEPAIAKLWAGSRNGAEGKQKLFESVGDSSIVSAKIEGRILPRPEEDEHADALLFTELMGSVRRMGAIFPDLYEYAPGVWLHQSVRPDPSVRLVGPVWIGAGHELRPGQVIVGPTAIPDAEGAACVIEPVPWADLALPNWPFVLPKVAARRLRRVTKRAFDIAFSLAVLLCTLPIYPIVMAVIMIEDGWPVFFAHRRQTIGGREFPCLKFRTMRKDAEAIKAELQKQNQADGPQFFIENDPRLLRCGAFLRKTQIDEMPQFINVLLGHMSVVGPRPSPDKENQFCPAWREARLSVRPGVTGLWQIKRTRAPETDFQEWIRYDLEYVQHESWRMDFWIIARTIKTVLGR